MDPVLEAAIGNPRIAGPYDSDTKYRVGNVPDDDVPDDDDTPVGVDGRRKDRAADYAVVVNGLVCTPPRSDQGADQNDLYNPRYRRARDGVLVNSDDSRIDFCDNGPEGDNGKDRHARIDKIEAEYHAAVKRGERHKRLDTGFPLLRAIRKRDGNVVQSGDNRKMFEAIALMLRGDFAIATGDVRSRLDDNPSFEPGEVDYSNKYDPTAFPDGPPAMGAAQREKMSVETITYTDPRTGAVWSGDVPSMVNAGVQQARAERRVWALLPTAEPSGWRRSHKSRVSSSGPVSHTGEPGTRNVFN
jgi:hypothetical protein